MQQTSKYQFNLVDATDDFSPDPLNQNAEKMETALAEMESDLAALTTAVGEGGHTCRIAFGSYVGDGQLGYDHPNTLTFDFYPMAVWVGRINGGNDTAWPATFLRPATVGRSDSNTPDHQLNVTWGDHTVQWYASSYTTIYPQNQCNQENTQYCYVAIGYDRNEA